MNRPLPDDVRARLRERVMAEVDQPQRARWRGPAAAAAAVAVLVGGGAALLAPSGSNSPAAPPTTSERPPPDPAESLDRCWAQVARGGQYPDRSRWRVVVTDQSWTTQVTAVRAGDVRFFCATTVTSVAISPPGVVSQPPASQAALFGSDFGAIGGVVPLGVKDAKLEVDEPRHLAIGGTARIADGVFVAVVGGQDPRRLGPVKMAGVPLELPTAPQSTVDRPEVAGDRSTPDGALVNGCVNPAYGGPVVDAPSWRVGARTSEGWFAPMLLVRNSEYVTYCALTGSGAHFRTVSEFVRAGDRAALLGIYTTAADPSVAAISGWAGRNAARVEVATPAATFPATLVDGTFVAELRGVTSLQGASLRVLDQAGGTVQTLPLS